MEETRKLIEIKAKKMEDIEKLIEERNSRYKSINLLIKERDDEFASKEKKHIEMSEAIRKLSSEIASKEKTLERARAFTKRLFEEQHKENESLDSTKKYLMKCTAEYSRKKDELRSVEDSLRECLRDLDIKRRELKSLESLFTEIDKQVEEGQKRMQRLKNSNENLSKKIQVKQGELVQVQSSITNLTAELESKEFELESVKKNIEDSLRDFQSIKEQQLRLEASLIKREKEFELKEKEFDAREEIFVNKDQQLKSMEQKLAKCVEDYEQKLAKCEKEFGLKEKELAALVERIDNKDQQLKSMEQKLAKCVKDYGEKLASSSQECALKDLDRSASFSSNEEVFKGLQNMDDPGRIVLNLFSDALKGARQRGERGLVDPIVKVLIPMFEELPRFVRPSEHLRAEARKLAQQWRLMVGNTRQMSPLEVWGFLQLIVAYGLLDSTKQNETFKLASNVAHFRQAPKLFQSLGLSNAIPRLLSQLIQQRKIIPAIRFMYHFNMQSPRSTLMNLIESLRRAASRLKSTVKEIDAGRLSDNIEHFEETCAAKLRDIIELIEDFNLDIDLPGDLIVKFMVPREAQDQNQFAVLSSVPCPTIPTIFSSTTLFRQGSESTAVQTQSSHQSGHKRPRDYPPVPSSVIRRCFNASSSHGV